MIINDNAGSLVLRVALWSIVGTPPGASSLLQGLHYSRGTRFRHTELMQ